MVAIPQINAISTGLESVAWSKGNSFWDISAIQCRDFGFTAAHSMRSRYISQSNTNIELNIWNFSRVWKIYCLAGAWKWAPLTSTNGPDTHPLIDGELAAGRLSSCRGSAIKVRHSESGGLETGWGWDGCVDAGFDKTVLERKVLGFKKEHPPSQSFAAIFPKDKTPTENPHWVSVIASLFVSQREKIKISAEQNFTSATLNNLWCFIGHISVLWPLLLYLSSHYLLVYSFMLVFFYASAKWLPLVWLLLQQSSLALTWCHRAACHFTMFNVSWWDTGRPAKWDALSRVLQPHLLNVPEKYGVHAWRFLIAFARTRCASLIGC